MNDEGERGPVGETEKGEYDEGSPSGGGSGMMANGGDRVIKPVG